MRTPADAREAIYEVIRAEVPLPVWTTTATCIFGAGRPVCACWCVRRGTASATGWQPITITKLKYSANGPPE